MKLVLDCSVAIAWLFEDESNAATDAILDLVMAQGAVVPGVWPFEVSSALLVAMRRGRITHSKLAALLPVLQSLDIQIESSPAMTDLTPLCDLAVQTNLSPYDAAYLQLAQERGLPLATLDKKLAAVAAAHGVKVLQ